MDLATLNTMRAANGQSALDKLPAELEEKAEGGGGGVGDKKDEKKEEAGANGGGADGGNGGGDKYVELTDEQLLSLLAKKGITAASLQDLQKKEEPTPEPTAEQREAMELAFGLTKGIFTRAEYDQFVSDTKDVKKLAYVEFYNETKAEDPSISDEDIEAEFIATYGLDKEKDSYQYKRGVKQLKARGEALLQKAHEKIFKARRDFFQTETETKNATAREKKIAGALPAYKNDVEAIIGDLKKLTLKISDQENIELDAEQAELESLRTDLLNVDYYGPRLAEGYDKEKIKQAVVAGYLAKNFTKLSVEAAKKYLDKHKAGSHGIPLDTAASGGSSGGYDPSKFTDAQNIMIRLHKEAEEKAKAAAAK